MADAGGSGAPPVQGPAITVSNGWASPSGDQDRTTVGIGELTSFIVNDVAGGRWRSADGKGATVNSVTFRWTASAVGTNTITYTAADGSTSSVTMTTIAPQSLSGKKDSEITTYAAGTQGAGMELTITVLPTTVSFQALEIMEGYMRRQRDQRLLHQHAPPRHDAAAGAGVWSTSRPEERRVRHRRQLWTAFALVTRQLHLGHPGPLAAEDRGHDIGDRVQRHERPGRHQQPSPWAPGSFTWAIPTRWRKVGDQTRGTAFSATSDEVVTITDTNGTTFVTKLGATSAARTP